MEVIIVNAFSFNMMFPTSPEDWGMSETLRYQEVSTPEVKRFLENKKFSSAVGHAPTAELFSSLLGTEVPSNRTNVQLGSGTVLVLGQYAGPRLEEGATSLPEGAAIRWFLIGKFGLAAWTAQVKQ